MTEARRISMLIPSSMNKTSSVPRYLSPTRLIRRQPEYHEIDTLQQPNHPDNRIRSRRGEKWRLQGGAGYPPATNGYFSRPPPCSASLVEQLANVLPRLQQEEGFSVMKRPDLPANDVDHSDWPDKTSLVLILLRLRM